MSNKRKKFSAGEKVKALRLYLIEKRPISNICDEIGLNPTVFYRWQQQFFENGAAAFERAGSDGNDCQVKTLEKENARLKAKLANKDEVIAEIMASHIELKKNLGKD